MAKKIKDPGVGYNSSKNVQSFVNDDGSSNILHINKGNSFDDLYSYLITLSWPWFMLIITGGFLAINSFFAFIYMAIGMQELGLEPQNFSVDFLNAFNFSAQTSTTVGYGSISPTGNLSGMVSSIESLVGLMMFAFITGLLYGRFSKPKTAVRFSKSLIVREFNGQRALMFRLMNKRKTIMIEPEVEVTLSITEPDNKGNFKRSFYQLKLEREKISYLPTMWTIVHIIDDKSPLKNYTSEELIHLNAGVFILFQYHEESYSQKLYKIHSYQFEDLKKDVKFTTSVKFSETGQFILDHHILDKTEPHLMDQNA